MDNSGLDQIYILNLWDGLDHERVHRAKNTPFVIFSFGKKSDFDSYDIDSLYQIVEYRYTHEKPTVAVDVEWMYLPYAMRRVSRKLQDLHAKTLTLS